MDFVYVDYKDQEWRDGQWHRKVLLIVEAPNLRAADTVFEFFTGINLMQTPHVGVYIKR